MDILSASHMIEIHLRSISSPNAQYSDLARKDPYGTIMNVLRCFLPRGAEKFERWYKPIEGKSLDELQEDGYDIEMIVNDLKNIVNGD